MPTIIIVLLALPIIALGLILVVRRSRALSGLAPGLVLSGVTGSVLTALFAFSASTVPIGPYESGPTAWSPVVGGLLLALYVGFGMGALVAALAGIPYWYLSGRGRRPPSA